MRTPLKIAGCALAVAVAVVSVALVVLPGLATATPGATEPAVDLPLLDPSSAAEPARVEPAPAPVDPLPAPAQVEPAPAQIDPAPAPVEPAPVEPAPAAKPAEPRSDPDGSVSSPVMPFDPGYWTPERMANAKPMPMPTVP